MKILILHAYSADNLGDGLLVAETLRLVGEAFGPNTEITVAASRPESFRGINARIVNSAPSAKGFDLQYLRVLLKIKQFDLVVGVGGGYLRAGNVLEACKTLLVHGPQLLASSFRGKGVVYLPQSVGPIRFGLRPVVSFLLGRLETLMLRDDRSKQEFNVPRAIRIPDLATRDVAVPNPDNEPDSIPILSVRAVRNTVPSLLYELAGELEIYDSYVQSTSGGNDDRPATATFAARRSVSRSELLESGTGQPRIVIAVRLHAALMALRAGHFVIHLAYERKGFGAFADLGLSDYVHNVNSFSPLIVARQARELQRNKATRAAYVRSLLISASDRRAFHMQSIGLMKQASRFVKGFH